MRHAAMVIMLALAGCGERTIADTGDGTDDASEFNASLTASCGLDGGPLLVLVEVPSCDAVALDNDGFNVWWSPDTADEDLVGTHDVLELQWDACRLCSQATCEDASSCTVEITEASDMHVLGRLDAVFPSGSLSRELDAVFCPLESACL